MALDFLSIEIDSESNYTTPDALHALKIYDILSIKPTRKAPLCTQAVSFWARNCLFPLLVKRVHLLLAIPIRIELASDESH